MKKKKAKPGPKLLSPYTKKMDELIKDTYINLPENKRRTYAAVEALKLPRGGKRYISKLLGCSRSTIRKGIAELKNKDPESVAGNRIRAKGAGRKPAIETIENIDEVFLSVIDNHIAGDPMDEKIRWTNLSRKKIAEKMKDEGIEISVTVVQNLLKKHGFVKRKALKKKPIGSCKQRNEQFEKIAQLKQQYQDDGNPIVSIDTKKKNF